MESAIKEQNRRLVEYAEGHIMLLGETINSWNSRHHMDAEGNLLDSLCWGVCYNGETVANGFYRNQKATDATYMHGWSNVSWREKSKKSLLYNKWIEMDAGEPVYGHERAEAFLAQAHKKCKAHQWMVFFAILAPYWGYWEKGFHMTKGFGGNSSSFLQFAVMTQFYDQVKASLKPAKTRISVYVDRYASKSLARQAKKNYY